MLKKTFGLMLAGGILASQTACDQKDNPPPSETVPITADYPADYFVVLPDVVLPDPPKSPEPVVQTVYVQKEIERQAEKMAEEKAKKLIERERKKAVVQAREEERRQEIKKEAEKKQDFREYVKQRSELIRVLRRQAGGSFLTRGGAAEQKQPLEAKVSVQVSMKDKTYAAPSVLSSYPVDRSFILTEDRTIAAVLLDGINSQIPGSVRVMVAEDVFGADGRYKLLEKGDIVLGRYDKTTKVGETRLGVSFYRIIRSADGAEIYSAGTAFAYAADKMGRAGLVGDVDNRNWERYGLAFGTSLIGGLAGLGKAKVKGDEYEEFWNRLSDNTTEITTKVLEQYMNIAPVITIAQGEPILIRLAADISLKHPTGKEEK